MRFHYTYPASWPNRVGNDLPRELAKQGEKRPTKRADERVDEVPLHLPRELAKQGGKRPTKRADERMGEVLLHVPGELAKQGGKRPTQRVDKRVAGKAVVPAHVGVLVFRRQGNQLGGVEALEESPQLVEGADKQDVSVHVDQGVHLSQESLQQEALQCYTIICDSA